MPFRSPVHPAVLSLAAIRFACELMNVQNLFALLLASNTMEFRSMHGKFAHSIHTIKKKIIGSIEQNTHKMK